MSEIVSTRPEKGLAHAAAKEWEKFYSGREDRMIPRYPIDHVVRFVARRVKAASRGRAKLRVLDLGCGGGRHLWLLEQEKLWGVGMDYSPTSLAKTRRRLKDRGRLVRASYLSIPFGSGHFDAVICYGVLCYGLPDEIAAGVAEVRRILKSGGWALLWFRGTEDCRYGKGREVVPHCFVMDTDATDERGMPVSFFDAAGIDALVSGFRERFVGFANVGRGPGLTDSDWLVEVRK